MEAALLLRGNPRASGEMVEKGREFAGLTLVDMARECLNAAGVKTRGMDRATRSLGWRSRVAMGPPSISTAP